MDTACQANCDNILIWMVKKATESTRAIDYLICYPTKIFLMLGSIFLGKILWRKSGNGERAKELFLLYKDIPSETPQDALRSQKEYREWFAREVTKQQKGSYKEQSINKKTEQINPADAKSRTAD